MREGRERRVGGMTVMLPKLTRREMQAEFSHPRADNSSIPKMPPASFSHEGHAKMELAAPGDMTSCGLRDKKEAGSRTEKGPPR